MDEQFDEALAFEFLRGILKCKKFNESWIQVKQADRILTSCVRFCVLR